MADTERRDTEHGNGLRTFVAKLQNGMAMRAYLGPAARGALPGIGEFILVAEDVESLALLWDVVIGGGIELNREKVKQSAVTSEEVAHRLAEWDRATGDCP